MKIIYISGYSSLGGRQANLTQVLYTCDALTKKTKNLYLIAFVPLTSILNTSRILRNIDKELKLNILPIPFIKLKGIYLFFDIVSILISIPFICLGYKIYTRNQRFSKWIYFIKKEIYIEIHDLSKKTLDCVRNCKRSLFLSNTKKIITDIKQLNLKRYLIHLPNAAKLTQRSRENSLINFKSPAVGYIGSNNIGKGVDTIIKIAKINTTINYYLAGYIKIDNLPKNIYLMGLLNKHQIREMLDKVDLLVAPYENLILDNAGNDNSNYVSPLKVFEYMASKKPFIISRLEFAKDFLIEDHDCLMASPSDMSEWISNIERIINDKYLSEKLSKNAFKKYLENFTWEIRADKILNIISKGFLI